MSCTVVAVPFALSWVVNALIVGTAVTGGIITASKSSKEGNSVGYYAIEDDNSECEDSHSIAMEHFIEKEFETPFTNKELLLKTLEEHGVKDIQTSENSVSGVVDNYILNFSKSVEKENYILKVSCNETCNADEKVNDLASEYSMNVQEDAYLHLLDKLKENNMQIEEEVVEDDNTIVITVNLD